MLIERVDFFCQIFDRGFLELRDAYPPIARLDDLGLHALHLDFLTNDRDHQRLVFFFAGDSERNLGVGLAAHALDGFVERHALDRRAVETCDQVARFQASLVSGRILDRRNDFDIAVFHADFDAQADEFALRTFTQFLECFLVEVSRVRIKRCHHAGNGFGQQLFVFYRFDII